MPADAVVRVEPSPHEPALPSPQPIDLLLLEAYLDALLGFARRIQLIERAQLHRRRCEVTIHIPACACTLSYPDAIDFLCQSISEEMRPAFEALRKRDLCGGAHPPHVGIAQAGEVPAPFRAETRRQGAPKASVLSGKSG